METTKCGSCGADIELSEWKELAPISTTIEKLEMRSGECKAPKCGQVVIESRTYFKIQPYIQVTLTCDV